MSLEFSARVARLILVIAISGLVAGCGDSASTTGSQEVAQRSGGTPSESPKTISPPSGRLVFQPRFLFADENITHQGTGFFVADSKGKVLGVTSAHFIDFEGPPMVSAAWIAFPEFEAVTEFEYSYGAPGDEGTLEPIDLRRDYLIVAGEKNATEVTPLELDERKVIDENERVWLPNKDQNTTEGHTLVEGTVVEASKEYVTVILDEEITLQSQSGSPLISQQTGKVIGTLSRGGNSDGSTVLFLCPARSILDAIEKEPSLVPLRKAIGKPEKSQAAEDS